MSRPNTVRRKRRPTHPGEMLRGDYLPNAQQALDVWAAAQSVKADAARIKPLSAA
ncbi:MAG: hypothetical protein WD042_10370 [Phycisphaeraceae bacterium]